MIHKYKAKLSSKYGLVITALLTVLYGVVVIGSIFRDRTPHRDEMLFYAIIFLAGMLPIVYLVSSAIVGDILKYLDGKK